MFHLFLQAVQTIQQIQPTPPTDPITASTLLYAIGACLLSIGGLIAWLIKATVPKFLENTDKRTDALIKAVEVMPECFRGIAREISSSIDDAKDEIIAVVQDNKIKDLAERFSTHSIREDKSSTPPYGMPLKKVSDASQSQQNGKD